MERRVNNGESPELYQIFVSPETSPNKKILPPLYYCKKPDLSEEELSKYSILLILGPGTFFPDTALKCMHLFPKKNILAISLLPFTPNGERQSLTDIPEENLGNLLNSSQHALFFQTDPNKFPDEIKFESIIIINPYPIPEVNLITKAIQNLQPNGILSIIIPEEMLKIPYGGQWLPYDEVLRRMGLTEVKREVLDDNNPFAPRSFLFGKWQLPPEELDGWKCQQGIKISCQVSNIK